jgi:phospholipid/cholesterol/gamma-HCH transport system substrate-binding protein
MSDPNDGGLNTLDSLLTTSQEGAGRRARLRLATPRGPRLRGAGKSARTALRRVLPRTRRQRIIAGIGALAVAAAAIFGGRALYDAAHPGLRVTVYFTESIGIYPGSDVRILGVRVGVVNTVQPDGQQVKVTLTVDNGVPVPAGAEAAVVAPSVLSDRYVQLTPAYTGGPRLSSGAVIPITRTAVPVEIDQIYAALNQFAAALGPSGANKKGALSNLIKTGEANLAGNGGDLSSMLTQYGGLSKTLGGSAGNIAATLVSLEQFTSMLKSNDDQVRLAEQQLAQVTGFQSGDRQQLTAAIDTLATALSQVQQFIESNRSLLTANVNKLASITDILSSERASLAEALDDAPLAADNLLNAYDATTKTLDGRADLNEFSMTSAGTTAAGSAAGDGPVGSVAVLTADTAGLPPLPLPSVGTEYSTPQALLAAMKACGSGC